MKARIWRVGVKLVEAPATAEGRSWVGLGMAGERRTARHPFHLRHQSLDPHRRLARRRRIPLTGLEGMPRVDSGAGEELSVVGGSQIRLSFSYYNSSSCCCTVSLSFASA